MQTLVRTLTWDKSSSTRPAAAPAHLLPELTWNLVDGDWPAWQALHDEWLQWSVTAHLNTNIDSLYASWLLTFQRLAATYIGTHRRCRPTTARKPWWSSELRPLLRKRDCLRKHYHAHPTAAKRRRWQQQAKLAKRTIAASKQRYLGRLADGLASSKTAHRDFWHAFNNEFRPRNPTCALQRSDGTLATNDEEKVCLLNEHFASISSSRARHAATCSDCAPDNDVGPYLSARLADFTHMID